MGNIQSEMSVEGTRIRRVLNLITVAIMVIVVIIYAGVRGYQAFHMNTAFLQTWSQQTNVNFPAITICPLDNAPLTQRECVYETSGVEKSMCLNTVSSQIYNIEGVPYSCLTFNSIAKNQVVSTSTNDEVAVQVSLNPNLITPDEPIGAIVIIHDVNESPFIESHSSFTCQPGSTYEVWLRLDEFVFMNGTTEKDYTSTVSSAIFKPLTANESTTVIDLDFSFLEQGFFVNTEYRPYNRFNWYGEVGGVACLLMFLQIAFVWIVMTSYGCIKGTKGVPFQDKTQQMSNLENQ